MLLEQHLDNQRSCRVTFVHIVKGLYTKESRRRLFDGSCAPVNLSTGVRLSAYMFSFFLFFFVSFPLLLSSLVIVKFVFYALAASAQRNWIQYTSLRFTIYNRYCISTCIHKQVPDSLKNSWNGHCWLLNSSLRFNRNTTVASNVLYSLSSIYFSIFQGYIIFIGESWWLSIFIQCSVQEKSIGHKRVNGEITRVPRSGSVSLIIVMGMNSKLY